MAVGKKAYFFATLVGKESNMVEAARALSAEYDWIQGVYDTDYEVGGMIVSKAKNKDFLQLRTNPQKTLVETGLKFHYAVHEDDMRKAFDIINRKCMEYGIPAFKVASKPLLGAQLGKDFTIYLGVGQDTTQFIQEFTQELELELARNNIRPKNIGQNLKTGDRAISGSKYGHYRFDRIDDYGNITGRYKWSYKFAEPLSGNPMNKVVVKSNTPPKRHYTDIENTPKRRSAKEATPGKQAVEHSTDASLRVKVGTQENAIRFQKELAKMGIHAKRAKNNATLEYYVDIKDVQRGREAIKAMLGRQAAIPSQYTRVIGTEENAIRFQKELAKMGIASQRCQNEATSQYYVCVEDTPQRCEALDKLHKQLIENSLRMEVGTQENAIRFQKELKKMGIQAERYKNNATSKYYIGIEDTPQGREALNKLYKQHLHPTKMGVATRGVGSLIGAYASYEIFKEMARDIENEEYGRATLNGALGTSTATATGAAVVNAATVARVAGGAAGAIGFGMGAYEAFQDGRYGDGTAYTVGTLGSVATVSGAFPPAAVAAVTFATVYAVGDYVVGPAQMKYEMNSADADYCQIAAN